MRYLLFLIPFGFAVYAFFDCLQTPQRAVRTLPKAAWLLVVWLPVVGGAAWLAVGRPAPAPGGRTRVVAPPVAPDDDPEFLRQIHDVDEEHRRLLQQWEDDLRRRERDTGPRESPDDDPPT